MEKHVYKYDYKLCKKGWNPGAINHSAKLDPGVVKDCTRESALCPPKEELEPETKRNSVMGDTVCFSCRCWRFQVTYNTCVCANTDMNSSFESTDPLLRNPHYLPFLHD